MGLSFVVFDPSTGTKGQPTQTIYVGSTDPGPSHLFRSTDAGQTWQPVPGQPSNFMAIHAAFDTQGLLYVVYGNSPGPGGATDGAVWKLNPKDGAWTDITPVKDANRFPGGYGGLGVDRQHPGTLVVASLDRKDPKPGGEDDDRIYRTTDGGQTWTDISPKSHRDSSAAPCALGGRVRRQTRQARGLGRLVDRCPGHRSLRFQARVLCHRHDDLEHDGHDQRRFRRRHALDDLRGRDRGILRGQPHQPARRPALDHAVSDCGGFTHDDLDVSPAQGANLHPLFANSMCLDCAYMNPSVVVRTGVLPYHGPKEGTMGYSLDGGHNWKPFAFGEAVAGTGRGGGGGGQIILSADGAVFMATGGTPRISTDRGATWKDVTGLPAGLTPIADRANAKKFYALDAAAHKMYLSSDGGATFTSAYEEPACRQPVAAGRPARRRRRRRRTVGRGGGQRGRPLACRPSFAIRPTAVGPSGRSPTIRRSGRTRSLR